MTGDPLPATRYAPRQTEAADGRVLYDVIDASAPAAPTLYRSPNRVHAQSVADDLTRGALDPVAVHGIYVEPIAAGWYRPVDYPFAWRLPWPWTEPADRGGLWQRAARRIDELRGR